MISNGSSDNFELFLEILDSTNQSHLSDIIRSSLAELQLQETSVSANNEAKSDLHHLDRFGSTTSEQRSVCLIGHLPFDRVIRLCPIRSIKRDCAGHLLIFKIITIM